MGWRRMEAACCRLLASLLCFCFPSYNAGFVAVWRMSGERERYANRTAPQCQPGVCVSASVWDAHIALPQGCVRVWLRAFALSISSPGEYVTYRYLSGFCEEMVVMFSPRCVSLCEPFMVTDSIHLSCPFTVKRQLPVKSSLDSFSSSPTTAAVDSSAQESPP